ncbi:NAD(P)-dependent oxidoreductase [Rhodococcus sp. D2-41]|uniref:NAD(P)-dependent oxidoreductase n=1 Tax=Speluncibacter jeojiensis TaxID=2710754 RepID=UPI00240F2B8A|nr:NAD(P)-dependent oxidoreductase [Rhodococcus sp. D2-41]MDG3012027.1 NAD(P)-dependent oxidoreductase [Rhodococcus sp. D2-41]
MTAPTHRLGWLGTGRMGVAMASRLLAAGNELTVWNRTRAKTAPLADAGARVADAAGDLGVCDIVFTCVSASADLIEVVELLVAANARPDLIVDCSTVSAQASAQVRSRTAEVGVGFLAAPVSGNPAMVSAGDGSFVASGPEDAFALARPYLEQIGRSAVRVGEAEQSRLVKLCHNLFLGVVAQAWIEVTTLAEKGGVPRADFLEFLNGTVLASDWIRRRSADLITENWSPTFTMALLRKDFDLGLGEARAVGSPMQLAATVHEQIQSAIGAGLTEHDFLALYLEQARAAGLRG